MLGGLNRVRDRGANAFNQEFHRLGSVAILIRDVAELACHAAPHDRGGAHAVAVRDGVVVQRPVVAAVGAVVLGRDPEAGAAFEAIAMDLESAGCDIENER